MSEKLKTALSGSFKFKPEIDGIHDEFTDLGVDVLEPSKGWLIIPRFESINGYRPLPGEQYMPGLKEIEERFLKAIQRSHFLYVCNFEGYLGTSTALEIGAAFSDNKPIFALKPFVVADEDVGESFEYVASHVEIATPQEVVTIMRERS